MALFFDKGQASCELAGHSPCRYRFCGFDKGEGRNSDPSDILGLHRGQTVSVNGDGRTRLWLVLSGVVAAARTLDDGRRQIVTLNTRGDVICPHTPTDEGGGWIEALSPSTLCETDLSTAANNMVDDADFMADMVRLMHRQLEQSAAHMVLLGRLDGMERVCSFLAGMTWRIGVRREESWWVQLPIGREDIADFLGLNPETVSRILSRIKKAKLATFLSPTEYVVHDLQKLQDRSPIVSFGRPDTLEDHLPRPTVARSRVQPI